MSQEAGSFKIGGHNFVFSMLNPPEAQRIIVRFAKMTAPAIETAKTLYEDGKLKGLALGTIIEKLLPQLDEDDTEKTVNALLKCATPLGMEDPKFQGPGGLKLMYQVVYKSAEINFKDFLVGFGGLMESVEQEEKDTTQEKQTSTG